MEQLTQSLPSLGLELNLAKCKVFGPDAHSAVHPGLADISRVTFADGIVVLGATIGNEIFIQQSMVTLVNKLVSLFNKFGRLDSSFAEMGVNGATPQMQTSRIVSRQELYRH